MSSIVIAIIFAILGFGGGFLVFHNNETAANKLVSTVESDATKVSSAASAVASDVKKA